MKKRMLLISSIIIILLIITIIVYSNRFAIKYRNINSLVQIEEYEDLVQSQVQIESMILTHAFDDGSWVVITESKMINELLNYFINLDITYSHCKDFRGTVGGGGLVTIFKIGEKNISISYSKELDQIGIADGRYYQVYFDIVSRKVENPFEKIYQQAAEKYGITHTHG